MTEKEVNITLALKEFPDYGDLMLREKFTELVEYELFIDYDGYGYLATKDGYLGLVKVHPSEWYFTSQVAPEVFTHVLWFNR